MTVYCPARGAVVVACVAVGLAAFTPAIGGAQQAAAAQSQAGWIARSDENAQVLLKLEAKYVPENAARLGVEGLEDQVTQWPAGREAERKADFRAAAGLLRRRLADESDPQVARDLRILMASAEREVAAGELAERDGMLPPNVAQLIANALPIVRDRPVSDPRREAATIRLRKYAGGEPGYAPLTEQAKARTIEWLKRGRPGPTRAAVQAEIASTGSTISGIAALQARSGGDPSPTGLLQRFRARDSQPPLNMLNALTQQLTSYSEWLRREVLPQARADGRLSPEAYAFALESQGIDLAPDRLATMAREAFVRLQREMTAMASQVAKANGLAATGYREVIRELQKHQLRPDEVLPHYQQRISEIEEIIRRERLVTLPERSVRLRMKEGGSPQFALPPLLNNTGQQGEVLLPRSGDDFDYPAASWTLAAHEARPGHELQTEVMLTRGTSIARAHYAFTPVNVEGWGMYAEQLIEPFMPVDGRLISLQYRLFRAARASIEIELQSGQLSTAEGLRILTEDVGLTDGFARSELLNYAATPGWGASYFYGYTRLLELRRDVETRLGKRFDQQAYHDFILDQGFLPYDLLRQSVISALSKLQPGIRN